MACVPRFVILVACLNAARGAATEDAREAEEACVEPRVKKQLVQARVSMEVTKSEEEEVAAIRRQTSCEWKKCIDDESKAPRCEDGSHSWFCKRDGHIQRQRCPCFLPVMCAQKTDCGDGKDYCCQSSCEDRGGERPCPTQKPTPEPPKPTPEPTPEPKIGRASCRERV